MWKISRLNLSDKLIYKTLTELLNVEVMDLQNVTKKQMILGEVG